jgi:hypothetical protein
VCAQNQKSIPESAPENIRPIELLTENGFSVLRLWEIDRTSSPLNGIYSFLVTHPQNSEHEITVEITAEVFADAVMRSRGRILPHSSFWIYCAERHLTIYLWENDDCPPGYRLTITRLDPDDCELTLRWETT